MVELLGRISQLTAAFAYNDNMARATRKDTRTPFPCIFKFVIGRR